MGLLLMTWSYQISPVQIIEDSQQAESRHDVPIQLPHCCRMIDGVLLLDLRRVKTIMMKLADITLQNLVCQESSVSWEASVGLLA